MLMNMQKELMNTYIYFKTGRHGTRRVHIYMATGVLWHPSLRLVL